MSFSPLRNTLFLISFCDVLQQKLFGTKLNNFYFKRAPGLRNFALTALQSDRAF